MYLAEAKLAFSQGNFARGLAVTDAIRTANSQSGIRSLLSAILYLRGLCFIGMGQREMARIALLEARAEAEQIQSRQMLMQILPALATLESDRIQAVHLLQQAEEFNAYIADHTPSELRATFLGRLTVKVS